MRGKSAPNEDPDDRYNENLDAEFGLIDDLDDDTTYHENTRQRAQRHAYRSQYGKPERRPAAEREGAFNALMWLLDGATGFVEELRHNDLGLPEDFWVHAGAARKESLMALRAVLDDWIDEDQPSPAKEDPPKRRGGIDIDF